MAVLQNLKRRSGLISSILCISILSVSCTGAGEPALSLEDLQRFATQTQEAIPTEDNAGPTPLPSATLKVSTATPILVTDPPPTSTPTLLPATRISFAPGATYGSATGTIQPGETKSFVLKAMMGQPFLASVSSKNNDIAMSIVSEDKVELLPAEQNRSSWQGSLPATQDYYIEIIGAQETENFSLWVSIPSRIKFKPGATSSSVSGRTIDGYAASYVINAQGGQTLDIQLKTDPDVAALTVWGFSDGQPYMRSVMGSTTFNMQLPSTQDYIVNVVPQGGKEVDFTMQVTIK